ncbi:MAG: efflux RND transporter permease subunit [Gemmobacter sp.]
MTDGFEVRARDTVIIRRDRMPTISVPGFTVPGVLADAAFAEVQSALEGIELPPGYRVDWGGEFESAGQAQESLGRQMPLAFGTMLLITVLPFGKLRQTAVIWKVVPMAVTGAAIGLLLTGLPFSFTALLGLLSLSGMLIKNAIVQVEEIDAQKDEENLPQSRAIVVASVSRLRPVVLAAGTTILGMAPLLFDPFFATMAVTIMAGLGFASVLTLIGVPVLNHSYLRAERLAERAIQPTVTTPPPPWTSLPTDLQRSNPMITRQTGGFSAMIATTRAFMAALAQNNVRDWFEGRKALFKSEIEAPVRLLTDLVAGDLSRLTGTSHSGKMGRICRDTRFSKDKSPYNTHIHAYWQQSAALGRGGFCTSTRPARAS